MEAPLRPNHEDRSDLSSWHHGNLGTIVRPQRGPLSADFQNPFQVVISHHQPDGTSERTSTAMLYSPKAAKHLVATAFTVSQFTIRDALREFPKLQTASRGPALSHAAAIELIEMSQAMPPLDLKLFGAVGAEFERTLHDHPAKLEGLAAAYENLATALRSEAAAVRSKLAGRTIQISYNSQSLSETKSEK